MFSEERLQRQLDAGTIIKKHHSMDEERSLRYYNYPLKGWRSWSLQKKDSDEPPRRHTKEVLYVTKDIFSEASSNDQALPEIRVCKDKATCSDYSTWQIVSDSSLSGLDGGLVADAAQQSGAMGNSWDSCGIELVSRPYMFAELGQLQTQSMLYVAAALLAVTSATVVTGLNSLSSFEAEAGERGGKLGNHRSWGQVGRAIGPLGFCSLYWWAGRDVAYAVGGAGMCGVLALVFGGLKMPKVKAT